jgi:AcrR family transcriptional regulator
VHEAPQAPAAHDAPRRALRADAERNRGLILEAAVAVFAERGLDAGVAEVAQRAGVGSATVFRRFPTKRDLILAVVEAHIAELHAAAQAGLEDPDPWAGLVSAMEAAARLQSRDRGLLEAVGRSVVGDPHLHAQHVALLEALQQLADRATDAGVLRDDVMATDLVLLAVAAAGTCRTAGGGVPDLWRRFLAIMLDGLRPAAATTLPAPGVSLAEILEAKSRAAGEA